MSVFSLLDKNVIFDWCDSQTFAGVGQQVSCDLVERVRAGRMVATRELSIPEPLIMFISELALAARLRRGTTLTLPEIAARLQMGSWKSFRAKLDRWKKAHETLELRFCLLVLTCSKPLRA